MEHAAPGVILVSTTKGIEAGSFMLMSEVLKAEAPEAKIGVLSGPNLAKEIAASQLTGTVIASSQESVRSTIQELLKSTHSGSTPMMMYSA